MAEKIINQNVEFVYCESNVVKKVYEILEQKFKYCKILIVCENEETKNCFKSEKNSNFFEIDFCLKNDINYDKKYDLYIVQECDEIVNKIKALSYLNNSQYIVCANHQNSINIFSSFVSCGYTQKKVYYPLGIIFNLKDIYAHSNRFLCLFLMNLSHFYMFSLEQKLNGHIFECEIDREYYNQFQELSSRIIGIKEVYQKDKYKCVDEVVNLFVQAGLLVDKMQSFDGLTIMAKNVSNQSQLLLQSSTFICSQILTKIYCLFLDKFKMNYRVPIVYEKHNQISNSFSNCEQFFDFDEKKMQFIINNFSDYLKEQIFITQMALENIFDLCKFFSLNFLYDYSISLKGVDFHKALILAGDRSKNSSLLKIINCFGLLV